MSEYFYCKVTIYNRTADGGEKSIELANVSYQPHPPEDKGYGKWVETPDSNVKPADWAKAFLQGRSATATGAEGEITYDAGFTPGGGKITFAFGCPYGQDNFVSINNQSRYRTQFYAVIGDRYGITEENGWGRDGWGQYAEEGKVPLEGHPMSILFVVLPAKK